MTLSRTLIAASAALLLTFAGSSFAQDAEHLPNFVPVLPQVKAKALAIDQKIGYLVKEVKPGVFVMTEGAYQSTFITTGKGVILFDAPPSFASNIVKAVAEVSSEPIVQIVYTHTHKDHIGGADLILKQIPNIQIIAEEGVANFLREVKDPHRPIPNRIFKNHRSIKLGTAKVELKLGHWHSPEGDLFVYMPDKKVLMAIDTLAAGFVPFMNFDLTMNMHDYLKVFDQLLAYDFDVLVAGHLTYLADRKDVQITKDYVIDVYKTVKHIHDTTDQMAIISQAAEKYTWDNKFALFRTLIDKVTAQCTKEIEGRWIDKLAGVDVFASSHCSTALVYARWDH